MAKIGINVDGVLCDKCKFQYEMGQEFFKNKVFYLNEMAYTFSEMFNCTQEQQDQFWKEYSLKYYLSIKPEEGASEFTRKLKDNNNTVYLIVDRRNITDSSVKGYIYRFLFYRWLKVYHICYDQIIFCDDENKLFDKYNACKEIGLDCIIDDRISDALVLSSLSEVLILGRDYNTGFQGFVRGDSFSDIFDCIQGNNMKRVKKL